MRRLVWVAILSQLSACGSDADHDHTDSGYAAGVDGGSDSEDETGAGAGADGDSGAGSDDGGSGGADTGTEPDKTDADGDGGLAADDCDDSDPTLLASADDGDCDGVLTADDCDDTDPEIFPGAEERCNELDDDCDGTYEDELRQWWIDADGDGYGQDDGEAVISCETLEGYAEEHTDCDDSAASTYPGATDTWYDGIDSDCDGANDFDQDTDGFDSDAHGGDDCDDQDSSIHPDATEICEDSDDNDCDGRTDYVDFESAGFSSFTLNFNADLTCNYGSSYEWWDYCNSEQTLELATNESVSFNYDWSCELTSEWYNEEPPTLHFTASVDESGLLSLSTASDDPYVCEDNLGVCDGDLDELSATSSYSCTSAAYWYEAVTGKDETESIQYKEKWGKDPGYSSECLVQWAVTVTGSK